MTRQYELLERVRAYDPDADEALLNKAYVFAMKAHGAQTRASGESFFSHPLEVAGLLLDYRLDDATIATALLHDTVEDTETNLAEIENQFGKEVAQLVDGVTKLTRLQLTSPDAKQAENFRKLVLAMSSDIRVLLVKLADRLHNMRTLHFIADSDKRKNIARETLEIYAPLAERIGMQAFKDQLQDMAFKELNPDARESILTRLGYLSTEGEGVVADIIAELERALRQNGLDVAIHGRKKTPYSIWQKMQSKEVEFEQLSDVMAFRIIVDSTADCYAALGVLHSTYKVVPGRFKDYISVPKPNGYRSLHTGIMGPQGQRIEVQIRTQAMHQVAEYGVAAHWQYKQGMPELDGSEYRWLRDLRDILEHANRPEEFLEHTKLELFQDQVFCFTPKGDLLALPIGATPVDFAYAVHSEVGDKCVGAKRNGRMVPLQTQLMNGDQVEIITSKNQTPSPTWERFVVSGKARARIRRFIRQQERSQYIELGRSILEKTWRQAGYSFSPKALEGVLKSFKANSGEDLMAQVGSGQVAAREIFYSVFPGERPSESGGDDKVVPLAWARRQGKSDSRQEAVPIKGLIPGMAVHYAGCCHPLPGDRIVGIVTSGKGVTIHTIDCETLERFADQPERWLDVAWEAGAAESSPKVGRLNVMLANEPGALGTLSTVIGKSGGNITNLKITNRAEDFFEMLVDVDVKDVKQLTNIITALRALPEITNVERARST